jgi:hypothetical protein
MIIEGLQPADYSRIQAPTLGIFNRITDNYRLPYYPDLDPAQQREHDRSIKALSTWVAGAIHKFRRGIKDARVIELKDTNHYIYIVDEAFVVRKIRQFLVEE